MSKIKNFLYKPITVPVIISCFLILAGCVFPLRINNAINTDDYLEKLSLFTHYLNQLPNLKSTIESQILFLNTLSGYAESKNKIIDKQRKEFCKSLNAITLMSDYLKSDNSTVTFQNLKDKQLRDIQCPGYIPNDSIRESVSKLKKDKEDIEKIAAGNFFLSFLTNMILILAGIVGLFLTLYWQMKERRKYHINNEIKLQEIRDNINSTIFNDITKRYCFDKNERENLISGFNQLKEYLYENKLQTDSWQSIIHEIDRLKVFVSKLNKTIEELDALLLSTKRPSKTELTCKDNVSIIKGHLENINKILIIIDSKRPKYRILGFNESNSTINDRLRSLHNIRSIGDINKDKNQLIAEEIRKLIKAIHENDSIIGSTIKEAEET